MKIRTTIYAEEGHVLTNGEVYVKALRLEVGKTADDYWEITDAEYLEIQKREAEEAGAWEVLEELNNVEH